MLKPVAFFIFFLFFFGSCIDTKQKLGEEIIKKIEAYKKANGHLPDSLGDIGIAEKEEGPVYYSKVNDSIYEIYYGFLLGESVIYNFKTHKWEIYKGPIASDSVILIKK